MNVGVLASVRYFELLALLLVLPPKKPPIVSVKVLTVVSMAVFKASLSLFAIWTKALDKAVLAFVRKVFSTPYPKLVIH